MNVILISLSSIGLNKLKEKNRIPVNKKITAIKSFLSFINKPPIATKIYCILILYFIVLYLSIIILFSGEINFSSYERSDLLGFFQWKFFQSRSVPIRMGAVRSLPLLRPCCQNHDIFHYCQSGTETLFTENTSNKSDNYQMKNGQGFIIFHKIRPHTEHTAFLPCQLLIYGWHQLSIC